MPSSGVRFVYLSPSLVPEPRWFESSGKFRGVGWANFVPFGRVHRPFGRRDLSGDSLAWSWCRAMWLGVGCSGQPVGQGAHVDVVVVLGLCGRLSVAFFYVFETARTLGRVSWWAQDVGVYVLFVAGVSSVFRGSCLFDFLAPWLYLHRGFATSWVWCARALRLFGSADFPLERNYV